MTRWGEMDVTLHTGGTRVKRRGRKSPSDVRPVEYTLLGNASCPGVQRHTQLGVQALAGTRGDGKANE